MAGTAVTNVYSPAPEAFAEMARGANVIPVAREIAADLETPISAYCKLADGAPSFLLESAEGGERFGRYSFIGVNPWLTAVSREGVTEITRSAGPGPARERREGNPLEVLRGVMAACRPAAAPELGRFWGGLVGWCSYDVARHLERLPGNPVPDLDVPESYYMAPEVVVIFDHLTHRMKVVASAVTDGDAAAAYRRAVARIEAAVERLRGPLPAGGPLSAAAVPAAAGAAPAPVAGAPASAREPAAARDRADVRIPAAGDEAEARASLSREEFLAAVGRAKEYIRAGDIFQVQVGVRRERPLRVPPFQVYRALRGLNPSPYLFYLDCGGLQLIGSSPEMLVRVEGGVVETRPIAGTRRRGRDADEDAAMERELLSDVKERAEHIMLVDLGRNDIGRVAAPGTVRVTALMRVERYSHVMHLVSDVQGRLAPGKDAFDALAACFPAGTLTGAPKVRAMEIIDELEPVRRGPYGGCAGYFASGGNMDACITIPTIVATGGRAYVQSAAGIVADSVPELEWKECENKARALLRALDLAEGAGPA